MGLLTSARTWHKSSIKNIGKGQTLMKAKFSVFSWECTAFAFAVVHATRARPCTSATPQPAGTCSADPSNVTRHLSSVRPRLEKLALLLRLFALSVECKPCNTPHAMIHAGTAMQDNGADG